MNYKSSDEMQNDWEWGGVRRSFKERVRFSERQCRFHIQMAGRQHFTSVKSTAPVSRHLWEDDGGGRCGLHDS